MSGNRRWRDLDEHTRRSIIAVAAVESLLKVVALIDLKRRPMAEIHGPKAAWAVALVLVNSAGALPVTYFVWGRRRKAAHEEPAGVADPGSA